MPRPSVSVAFVAFGAPALVCGCFALFSLDEYGPTGGAPSDGGPEGDATSNAEGGDGGAADAARSPRLLFVTSARFNGSMGGVSGADTRCNTAASAAGLDASFIAWVGQGTGGGPASRLSDPGRPIVYPDKTTAAGSLAELGATGPRMPIVVTETGTKLAAAACADDHVWTNARANGAVPDAGDDCDSWGNVLAGGGAGQLGGAHDEWTDGCGTKSCQADGHLYCFQK